MADLLIRYAIMVRGTSRQLGPLRDHYPSEDEIADCLKHHPEVRAVQIEKLFMPTRYGRTEGAASDGIDSGASEETTGVLFGLAYRWSPKFQEAQKAIREQVFAFTSKYAIVPTRLFIGSAIYKALCDGGHVSIRTFEGMTVHNLAGSEPGDAIYVAP